MVAKTLTVVIGLLAGICIITAIVIFILAAVVGVPHNNSASFTLPASIFLAAAAPLGAAAVWSANRRDQILTIRSSHRSEPLNFAEKHPMAIAGGRIDADFWKSIRGPVVAFIILVALTVTFVAIAVSHDSRSSTYIAAAAGVSGAICLIWAILWDPIYLRPLDIKRLAFERPDAEVWLNSTTAGLSTFASVFGSQSKSGPRLNAVGYIVVDAEGVEFWQRRHSVLVRELVIPRSFISKVAIDSVPLAFANQQGIMMTVAGPVEPPVEVPLIPLDPHRMISGRAASEFERHFNSA